MLWAACRKTSVTFVDEPAVQVMIVLGADSDRTIVTVNIAHRTVHRTATDPVGRTRAACCPQRRSSPELRRQSCLLSGASMPCTCVISGWHLTPLKPNVMITLKIRNDPHGTEVVLATKIYHLFLAFRRRSVCVPFGDSRSIDQSSFAALSVSLLPAVEAGTTYAEIPAGFGNVANLLGIPQYPQFAFKFALILVHEHLLLPKTGRLKEMSRE